MAPRCTPPPSQHASTATDGSSPWYRQVQLQALPGRWKATASAAARIDLVTCEGAPPRQDHLGDRTAFDAFIASSTLELPVANQLWRNTLLAGSLEQTGEHGTGSVAVVALDGDPGATKAIDAVRSELTEPAPLRSVTLESIVDAAGTIAGLRGWARRFEHRDLDVDAPDRSPDARDADGPALGARLTVPAA